jgi:membrane-associated phospholipid phosphatase
MQRRARFRIAAICVLAAAGSVVGPRRARAQDSAERSGAPATDAAEGGNRPTVPTMETQAARSNEIEPVPEGGNTLGRSFLKNLIADQRTIWTSPAHLRWADATWLFPLTAATAGFLATDRAVPPALPSNPATLNHFTSISSYGVYTLVGAGAGLYAWGRFTHDDHERETGFLAGEAAIDSLAADTALKYAFGRERPYEGAGLGRFYQGGTSFPSDHSALAWSIASVIAHEYPGPLTEIAAYGLATGVSASRVLGKQHFPSDVVVGAAVGWLIGREVYRAHHDPELGGASAGALAGGDFTEDRRERRNMGSPFVPLDSWVYAGFERLAALGYLRDALQGLKPWTRLECARLTEEASEALPVRNDLPGEAERLASRLEEEFARELNLLGGGRNFEARVESVYARAVSISGPPLADGYHFGQTVAYDFGRPFERGTNGQAGGSFYASAGPLIFYLRGEYQHAPAAPALTSSVVNTIAQADLVQPSQVPAGPLGATNRLELLDSYAAVNWNNWELSIGRQSLVWAPSPDDGMLWSDNIEPVKMVRLVNPEPFGLPWFLKILGPARFDHFFGRLEGHPYTPRPFIYGNKVNFKPFPWLELGVARTVIIGGQGPVPPGQALTSGNLIRSFFGILDTSIHTVPGKNDSEMDWTFLVPKVHNYIVLYGDSYATDDVFPAENPPRNPWNAGLYLTRVPGLAKPDFHIQGVSTENGKIYHGGNHGLLNYYGDYPDGYTQDRNIIGNTVGREGRAIRCWWTYWLSPEDMLRFSYEHHSVSADFIPGGGLWADYAVRVEKHFQTGVYFKSVLQFEHIARFPVLFAGPENNVTATLELGFVPERSR